MQFSGQVRDGLIGGEDVDVDHDPVLAGQSGSFRRVVTSTVPVGPGRPQTGEVGGVIDVVEHDQPSPRCARQPGQGFRRGLFDVAAVTSTPTSRAAAASPLRIAARLWAVIHTNRSSCWSSQRRRGVNRGQLCFTGAPIPVETSVTVPLGAACIRECQVDAAFLVPVGDAGDEPDPHRPRHPTRVLLWKPGGSSSARPSAARTAGSGAAHNTFVATTGACPGCFFTRSRVCSTNTPTATRSTCPAPGIQTGLPEYPLNPPRLPDMQLRQLRLRGPARSRMVRAGSVTVPVSTGSFGRNLVDTRHPAPCTGAPHR